MSSSDYVPLAQALPSGDLERFGQHLEPATSDDEHEELLGGRLDTERSDDATSLAKSPPSYSPLRLLLKVVVSLVIVAAIISIYAAWAYRGGVHSTSQPRNRITLDHIFNGTFRVDSTSIAWVPEAGDGVFSIRKNGSIKLVDLKINQTRDLVLESDINDEYGRPLLWKHWTLSPDMKYILVKADHHKQWRHSSFGNYYVHNLATKHTRPIIAPTYPPTTAYATWSPTGESLAFVHANDLYILPSADPLEKAIRITTTGTPSLFNGVPDWVYEEEVFSSDRALFFSPSSEFLAYLTFDETEVDTYTFPIYNPTDDSSKVVPYTQDVKMKYPKPGYNNPIVTVHVFDISAYRAATASQSLSPPAPDTFALALDWEDRLNITDSIIQEVKWVGTELLLMKEVNRNSDNGHAILFDVRDSQDRVRTKGKVVRKLGKEGEEGDAGWMDHLQSVYPLLFAQQLTGSPAYLDIVPSRDGHNHIALFSPASASEPIWLTHGDWEVTSGILGVDIQRGLIYFQAAYPASTERNIYSVPIPFNTTSEVSQPTSLTDSTTPSFYSAEFSPHAGFYLLHYHGPNVPWQRLIMVNNSEFEYIVMDNESLNRTLMAFDMPTVHYSTIDSEGYELNVKEIRPPRMDTSGRIKYPVLFHVYGGPSSQLVDVTFRHDWHSYLATALEYIIVVADGRGTGFKGRKLRNPVKGNLGYFETQDQIQVARIWAGKPYVDHKRIGIWGWSYGGFLSAKVVEAAAMIHSLAMAVAPVTSWKLYDSIYTERYMNLPSLNPKGYVHASITNMTGFHHVDFLLAHGSGDDNVHFANSAHLLDMFTVARVRKFRFRMFTDSDHAVRQRGAYRELHEWMAQFLFEKWGKGGRRAS